MRSFHELLSRVQSPATRSSSGIENHERHHHHHHHQSIGIHGSSALPGDFEAETFLLSCCRCCCCYECPEPVSRAAVEEGNPADPERRRFKRGTSGQNGGYSIPDMDAPRHSVLPPAPLPLKKLSSMNWLYDILTHVTRPPRSRTGSCPAISRASSSGRRACSGTGSRPSPAPSSPPRRAATTFTSATPVPGYVITVPLLSTCHYAPLAFRRH